MWQFVTNKVKNLDIHSNWTTVARMCSGNILYGWIICDISVLLLIQFWVFLLGAFLEMVLAERNSDSLRNGRRSRGPSPNGHASESSSEEEGGKKFK